VRASAGSALRMPMAVADDAAGCIGDLRRAGHVVVGARMDGTDADDMLWPERVALVLGSESHGVSPQVGALVEHWVRVPMAGYVESLNVAWRAQCSHSQLLAAGQRGRARRGPPASLIVRVRSAPHPATRRTRGVRRRPRRRYRRP
jgi:tRNA(Leu) C34 or U34 (ribose-2'-O)-methylase TrmL